MTLIIQSRTEDAGPTTEPDLKLDYRAIVIKTKCQNHRKRHTENLMNMTRIHSD